MTTTSFNPDESAESPFDDGDKLVNVVTIRFRLTHVEHRANARQLQLSPGDQVVVDGRHGPAPAVTTAPVRRQVVDPSELLPVLRRLNEEDLQRIDDNECLEKRAYRFALERIREREMDMKLIRTQAIHDGSRLVFYFSADGRIDFRALVRDLAGEFRTRIEMYQIGVRDGAQMIGGIGPCGRELCCSTFLKDFEPISIRMAKSQGLTLNPSKISGMCGRLMCCLVYEQKVYRRLARGLPRKGQTVFTARGEAEIVDVDVINSRVVVDFCDEAQRQRLALSEIRLAEPDASAHTVDAEEDNEPLWDGEPPRKIPPPDESE